MNIFYIDLVPNIIGLIAIAMFGIMGGFFIGFINWIFYFFTEGRPQDILEGGE